MDNVDNYCDMGTDCSHSSACSKPSFAAPAPAATASHQRCIYLRWLIFYAAEDAQDDSDYEEDEKAAALGPQIPPPDHNDYYGKGWQPPKPHDQAARLAHCAAGKAALCSRFTHAGCA